MIKITPSPDGLNLEFYSTTLPVYLDTWAIANLAKGDFSRRQRFVNAIHAGADLLLSIANVVEMTGPKGASFDAVKSFLNELGPHWVLIDRTPMDIVELERQGFDPAKSISSSDFMNAYIQNRFACIPPGKIIDIGLDFFRLGEVLDFVAKDETLPKQSTEFDDLLKTLRSRRAEYERDPSVLDQQYRTFNPSQPATFVCGNLLKTLIIESKSHAVKPHDGMDFWHAVIGSAFARFATLDNNWKRRVEDLPKPNTLARIYSAQELDQMVTDIELAVNQLGAASRTVGQGA